MHAHKSTERIHRFEAICRENGLPITVQRRVLIDAIVRTDKHPTAEELWDHAREILPDISRTTVYRILDAFVDLGLVNRVPHPRGATRFDGNVDPHHHIICTRCERVHDVHEPVCSNLRQPEQLPPGFQLQSCSVLFLGLCQDCQRLTQN